MPVAKSPADKELLAGLRDNDYPVLEQLYKLYLPETVSWIRSQGGNRSDALDIFQDSLLILHRKANAPDFELSTSLAAYLAGVRRYLWWHRQRKKNRRSEVTLTEQAAFIIEDNIESELIGSEKRRLFQEKLNQLGADCQQLLKSFFAGEALKTIADQMGFTYDYVKKKNRICKEKLSQAIKKDRRYQELSE